MTAIRDKMAETISLSARIGESYGDSWLDKVQTVLVV